MKTFELLQALGSCTTLGSVRRFFFLTYLNAELQRKVETERSFICWFVPQWLQWLELCTATARSLELHLGFPRVAGPKNWAIFGFLSPLGGSCIGSGSTRTQTSVYVYRMLMLKTVAAVP